MTKRVLGTEVQAYLTSLAPTGVPRVMRETHRYLAPALAKQDIELVPVRANNRSTAPERAHSSYVGSDSILEGSMMRPHDVDALLMLDPLSHVDFASLLRIRRERKFPVIAMIHDLLPIRHPEWFNREAERAYRIQLQQILHIADHVVVPSHHVRGDIQALGWPSEPQIHVIHLGSFFEQRPPARESAGDIRIIYVSTLAPRKGHATLLDAVESLWAQGKRVELVLVGKIGWDIQDVVTRIRQHPRAGTGLRWFEFADDDQVANLLGESTIGVIPAEGEGFGLFLEEALTAGLMVVASDLPVFRERAYPNVLFARPGAKTLADTILLASEHRPSPIKDGEVRTMKNFSDDLALVISMAMDA
jgi:glycosyltransferase involved in cell wall biosynthesis